MHGDGAVLEVEAASGWTSRLTSRTGRRSRVVLSAHADLPIPAVCDGLVAAVLPVVVREGGTLRITGPISRTALRNFTEIAEAWANWRPHEFRPIVIEPSGVVDGPARKPRHEALVAWSGSLRSTHVIMRHVAGLVPSPFAIRGVVRVWGVHPGEAGVDPAKALAPAVQVFQHMGLPLHIVTTTAQEEHLVDPVFGGEPWAAAALHRVGASCGAGLVAQRWSWMSQRIFPRPGPMLADLWSGDACDIRQDGGALSMVRMVRDLKAWPELMKLVSDCERRARHEPSCGRCPACTALSLARAAEGEGRSGLLIGMRLSLDDARWHAEAISVLREGSALSASLRRLLVAKVARQERRQRVRSVARWLSAAAGLTPAWPR